MSGTPWPTDRHPRGKYIFAINEYGHIVDPYTGYHRCIYNPLKGKQYYLTKKVNPSDPTIAKGKQYYLNGSINPKDPTIATFGDVIQITADRKDLLKQDFTNIDIKVRYRNPIPSYAERILPENKQNVQTQMMYELGKLYSNVYQHDGGTQQHDAYHHDDHFYSTQDKFETSPYTLTKRRYRDNTPYLAFISDVKPLEPTLPNSQQQESNHLSPYVPYEITLLCIVSSNKNITRNTQSSTTTPQYELLVREIKCFCYAIKYAILPPVGSLCTVITTKRNDKDPDSEQVFLGYLPIYDLMPVLKQHFNVPPEGRLDLNDRFVEPNQFKIFLEQKVEICAMLYKMLNMMELKNKYHGDNPFALYNELVKIANSFSSRLLTNNNNQSTTTDITSTVTTPINAVTLELHSQRQMVHLDPEAKDYFKPLDFDDLLTAQTPADMMKLLWHKDYDKMSKEQQDAAKEQFNEVEFRYLNRFDYHTTLSLGNRVESAQYSSTDLPFGVTEVQPGNLIVVFPHPTLSKKKCHKVIQVGDESRFSHSDGMRMFTMLNKHKELITQPLIPIFCDLPFAPHAVQQVLDGIEPIETLESINARQEYFDKLIEYYNLPHNERIRAIKPKEPDHQYHELSKNQVDLVEEHTPNEMIFKYEDVKLCSRKGEPITFQPIPKQLQGQLLNVNIDGNNNAPKQSQPKPPVLESNAVILAIPIAIELKGKGFFDTYHITFLTPTTHAAAIDDKSVESLDITNPLQFKRLTIRAGKRYTLPKVGTLGLLALSPRGYASKFDNVEYMSWLPISYKPLDGYEITQDRLSIIDNTNGDDFNNFVDKVHLHHKQALYDIIQLHRRNIDRYLHPQEQQHQQQTSLDFNFKTGRYNDQDIIVLPHLDPNIIPSDYTTMWDIVAKKYNNESFIYNPKNAIPSSTTDAASSYTTLLEIEFPNHIESDDEDTNNVNYEYQNNKVNSTSSVRFNNTNTNTSNTNNDTTQQQQTQQSGDTGNDNDDDDDDNNFLDICALEDSGDQVAPPCNTEKPEAPCIIHDEHDEIEITRIKSNNKDESGNCIASLQKLETDATHTTRATWSSVPTNPYELQINDRHACLNHLIKKKALTFDVDIKTSINRDSRKIHINIDNIVSTLGSGSFGTTFCVLDSNANKHYAVKVINANCSTKSNVLTLWREFDVAHRLRKGYSKLHEICQFYGEYPHNWHRNKEIIEMVKRFKQERTDYNKVNSTKTNENTWSSDVEAQKLNDKDINTLNNFFKNHGKGFKSTLQPDQYTGYACLVMEYIPQPQSLTEKMNKIRSIPNVDQDVDPQYHFTREEIHDITIGIIKACKHLSDSRIIHRDIKPENIRLYRYDNICNDPELALDATYPYIRGVYVKLVDFGCAQPWDESDKVSILHDTTALIESQTVNTKIDLKSSTLIGSPAMIPPEVLGSDTSWLSTFDAFSAGITILTFILGYVPGCYGLVQDEFVLQKLKEKRQNMSCDHYLVEYVQYYNGLKNGKSKHHITNTSKSKTHSRLKIVDEWLFRLLRNFLARNPYRRDGGFYSFGSREHIGF